MTTNKEERLVSVHGQLVPLPWTCGEAEHHGGQNLVEKSCSAHGGQEAKEGGGQGPGIPFEDTPPGTYFLQLGSPPEVSISSLAPAAGSQAFNMGSLGDSRSKL